MENLEEFELVAKGMRKREKSNEKKRLSFADATVAVIAGKTFQRMGTIANQKTSESETNESEKPCVFLKTEIIEELQLAGHWTVHATAALEDGRIDSQEAKDLTALLRKIHRASGTLIHTLKAFGGNG